MRIVLSCIVLALVPVAARAQPVTRLPRADASVSMGWLHADVSGLSGAQDNWAHSRVTINGQAGFYWTEHLKTELSAERSNTQHVYAAEQIPRPGGQVLWRSAEHEIGDTRLSIGQFYQFGHNAWTHLSIGGGVSITRRQIETQVFPLFAFERTGQEIVEPGAARSDRDTRANAFAAATIKAYVTPRVFVRSELQTDFRKDLDAVVVRVGVGVDF